MPDVGSWQTLVDVARAARQIAEQDAARPEVACPRDGEPLRTGPRGERHCSFDGYLAGGGR